MLCWGHSGYGQLGIGCDPQAIVTKPQTCTYFLGMHIKEVASGGYHSAFLLEGGKIFTCGLNSKGQLGHYSDGIQPVQVEALAEENIIHIACGELHSLAVSSNGQLFSWGDSSDGQLGHATMEVSVSIPRFIRKLNQEKILQVSCGSWHCLALADDGQLFTWGQNSHGQLGLGEGFDSQASPQRVKSLEGIPLAQVSAGGSHSFALSLSGAVFGWGKNDAGQLGLNDEQDRTSPCHVKPLRSQKVVYISCGKEHTAILTKGGGVFTFGAGDCGQLGHDSLNNEINPRRVLELMGSEVSQIACGKQHTLAFVPSSGVIYAFGSGTRGQLGSGHMFNVKCPSLVKATWAAHTGQTQDRSDSCAYHVVKRIFCGGDQSFVLLSRYGSSLPPDDFRFINHSSSTNVINNETIDVWQQKVIEYNDPNSINGVIQTLSSSACWNGSFLEIKNDEHFKTSPKIPGISLCSIRVLFEKLMHTHHSRLLEQIRKGFETFLIPQLPSSPPDVEAMRIYLILPEFPLLQDSQYYINLTLPLAMAILRLDTNPSKVLDNWWSQVCPSYFFKLVDLYKGAVVYLLNGRKTLLIPVLFTSYITAALGLLEKLHKVNVKVKHVEYDKFYIPEVSSLVDIQEDYLLWFLNQAGMKVRPAIMQDSVTLCSYPFIFDAQAKTKMLQTDAELQMQVAINGANLQNVFMLLTLEPLLARNPFLVLHVRRSNLVGDALRELSIYSDIDFKKPLKVIFDGEEAVDDGGVTKEFFLLLLKELLNPIYGMFTCYPDSNLLWFSDTTDRPSKVDICDTCGERLGGSQTLRKEVQVDVCYFWQTLTKSLPVPLHAWHMNRRIKCFVEHNWFHLIGIVCGLAIYNFTVVDLQFPLALYKKLLDTMPVLEDLLELSPTEGRSLQQLLDYPDDDVEDVFCLNFTICRVNYGVTEMKMLVPGGDKITVKKDNRQEFVDAYLNYVFNLSVCESFGAFSSGFLKVCGGKVLELFQPSELKAMVVGNSNYNWEELEECAVYKGEYSAVHPTVRIFWEVFHNFPLEQKKKFLCTFRMPVPTVPSRLFSLHKGSHVMLAVVRKSNATMSLRAFMFLEWKKQIEAFKGANVRVFLTGSDRIPIYGMSSLRIIIQSTSSGEQYLPVAHTCYNLLDLPQYKSRETMKDRLTKAIDHCEGFSLA